MGTFFSSHSPPWVKSPICGYLDMCTCQLFWGRGGRGEGGRKDQWAAWNWSCDLLANERPWEKVHPMAQTTRQTSRHFDGHADSLTESAQLLYQWMSRFNKLFRPTLIMIILNLHLRFHWIQGIYLLGTAYNDSIQWKVIHGTFWAETNKKLKTYKNHYKANSDRIQL